MKMDVTFSEASRTFVAGFSGTQIINGGGGKDGVSPTIDVSKSGKVTTVTIKDAQGTKTATINDGDKGDPGHTPVRGKDYWTEADKAAMVQDVLASLPVYTGEVADA